LLDEELFLVSPKPGKRQALLVKPVTLKALCELPLVIPSRPNAIRMAVESQLSSQGLRPRIALEIDGVGAILDLVADGAGHAVLPQYALANAADPESFALRSISPRLKTHLALATASSRTNTQTQQAMLDLLEELTLSLLSKSPSH
jgi:LysR family nitrogen assimilation transcriptional regulator